MNPEAIAVLQELRGGRGLVRKKHGLRWEDGVRRPSLRDGRTSMLFRAGLIAPEYVGGAPHTPDNLTGRVILTDYGRTWLDHQTKERP